MKKTRQETFWESSFGTKYTERNTFTPKQLDALNKKRLGITRTALNRAFLKALPIHSILEVGSNVGNQLRLLQKMGYHNLYGIEINEHAVKRAKHVTNNINILHGSAFDLPFKDNYFDLVLTAGVLIHISPKNLKKAMQEIYRVSKKYIWGYEYYSSKTERITYRGNKDRLWKADYSKLYRTFFPKLKLVKEQRLSYRDGSGSVDTMFLLKKS